jgi:hypothetical protein
MTQSPNAIQFLWCNHCGGAAIEADDDGCFTDGDGGACITCGFPGWVHACSETSPWWSVSEEPEDQCEQAHCAECRS